MLLEAIILVTVAIIAGYAGAKWQKRRQGSITKREATELIKSVAEMREVFDQHTEVHKIIKYDIEVLGHNVTAIGQVVGMEQSRSVH